MFNPLVGVVSLSHNFNDCPWPPQIDLYLLPLPVDFSRLTTTSAHIFCSAKVPAKVILGDPGAVSGGGKKSKRARKKIGRRKVKNENRSPWDSSLNQPVPKPFKILACDWAQKYFCAQSESSSFRVTFVTSYSKVFSAKLFDRLFAIYLLARAGEFPTIEKCH